MRVHARPTRRSPVDTGAEADVQRDQSFRLEGLFGPQLVDVEGLPAGWALREVRFGGASITSTPTEFATSVPGQKLEIYLRNR
jgi:hypothetical protein